jgi:hypothetical protein
MIILASPQRLFLLSEEEKIYNLMQLPEKKRLRFDTRKIVGLQMQNLPASGFSFLLLMDEF